MNVFGNALKYTQKGSIVVKLSLDEPTDTREDPTEERMLEIKITDTGKGISSEYLRTRLFNRELTRPDRKICWLTDVHQLSARRTSLRVAQALVYQLSSLLSPCFAGPLTFKVKSGKGQK